MFRSVISCLLLLTVLCVNVHNSTLSAQSDQSSQEMKRSFSIIRSYESDGQFERAIEEGEKLLVECEKNYPELSPRLYDILSHAYSSMTDFDSAIEYADKAIEKAKLYSDYSFEDILLLKQNKLSSLTNNSDFEAAMPLVAEIELAMLSYLPLMGSLVCLNNPIIFFSWPNPIQIKYLSIQRFTFYLICLLMRLIILSVRAVLIRRGISIKLCKQRMITCWCIYIVFMAITILAFGITRKPWNPM